MEGNGVIPTYREKLTGRSRHRANSAGQLILQVEYKTTGAPLPPIWRDAKAEDLLVSETTPDCTL
ncbi:hypothetical protein DK867_02855 [Ochrobactrum sp. POC9]|nr:hypothetical protein DK867_02855 [Ochrobactrum sp. POC9]